MKEQKAKKQVMSRTPQSVCLIISFKVAFDTRVGDEGLLYASRSPFALISYFLRRFASCPSLACACDIFSCLIRSHHKNKERVVKSNSLFHPQSFVRVLRPYALPSARKNPTPSCPSPPSPFSSPIILIPRGHRPPLPRAPSIPFRT
jgi:hypothetical protein